MRIIAGQHRSRKLIGPKDAETTRPITDRVKESLFSRLTSLGMIGEGRVLDIFSGTGSLGLEALSRGAAACTFIERDREAVRRLERNIRELDLDDRCHVITASAFTTYWLLAVKNDSVRIAFIDPPYAVTDNHDGLRQALHLIELLAPRLEDGGVVVLRTRSTVSTPEVSGCDGPASFTYGTMALHFYQRPSAEEME